jgi:MiaB/RimO family radical SAM methylthiotransferase
VKTFCIQTLGCKVNQYEGEQLAELLRARGLEAAPPDHADLRIVHTCSVTVQAASKSRQTARRAVRTSVRLPVLQSRLVHEPVGVRAEQGPTPLDFDFNREPSAQTSTRPRVVVSGCWATSDREAAAALPGVDAVLTHRQDVAAELDRLLALWRTDQPEPTGVPVATLRDPVTCEPMSEPLADDGWISEAGTPAGRLTQTNKAIIRPIVNQNLIGTTRLPILGTHQTARQRAFLKIQDGCDAHCTYCIIPSLRPGLWSKPLETVVDEARALVDAGHIEIVLTGIFLGAYGQPTALRRRQPVSGATRPAPLGELIAALCTRVPGLRRLRLSSLEPGDLTPALLEVLRDHAAVVPHFHLPLQSGSQRLLRRMNRQYTRDDFLRMVDRVNDAFDRPALTTDVIVGFPGETDEEFQQTVEVVDRARFIHVHAFSFSPRPGTAAARWRRDFVRGPVVDVRIDYLTALARKYDFAFRQQFIGEPVELLVEQVKVHAPSPGTPGEGRGEGLPRRSQEGPHPNPLAAYREREPVRHGRCERYFDVTIAADGITTGDFVRARIVRVTPEVTYGEVLR